MRKWIVWVVGVVLGVVILGVWLISCVLMTRHFTMFTVLIETPGGPVPIGVTFWDNQRGMIQVGNRDTDSYGVFHTAYEDFRIVKFDRGDSSFEIKFPQSQTTLVIKPLNDGSGRSSAEGNLIVHQPDGGTEMLRASYTPGSMLDWFGELSRPAKPVAYCGGNWQLDLDQSITDGMMFVTEYIGGGRNTRHADIHAELLVYETEHRYFSGNISGNRIRLASFDNAYPALIDATIQDDGTLKGDLWVGDRLHESFVGTRE